MSVTPGSGLSYIFSQTSAQLNGKNDRERSLSYAGHSHDRRIPEWGNKISRVLTEGGKRGLSGLA